jgi:P pilus assembly chaperone PapD
MKVSFKNKVRSVLTALLACIFVLQPVAAMTVQPVIVDLKPTGRDMSQVVTVQNTSATALPIEIRVEELSVDDAGVHATGHDSGDLLVFPPQAVIEPGQSQAFRIQWVGDPALAKSKHYYVTVAQLPVKLPQGQSSIQILYNFQVLVSVSPANAKPQLKIVSASIGKNASGKPVPVIRVSNESAAHGYLSHGRLQIVQQDASGHEIFSKTMAGPEIQQIVGFGLIAAGQTRQITIPVELPADGGRIEANFTPDAR